MKFLYSCSRRKKKSRLLKSFSSITEDDKDRLFVIFEEWDLPSSSSLLMPTRMVTSEQAGSFVLVSFDHWYDDHWF